MRKLQLLLFFLATIAATCQGLDEVDHGRNYNIYPLRLKSGSGGHHIPGLTCSSWRLGVETHNIIEWITVPEECEGYVGNYMLGHQYREDSEAVTIHAFRYAKSLNLTGDGKDTWVFDIDETTLSNLPYYAKHGFGVNAYNSTSFNEWVNLGVAPALPSSLKLYWKLLNLGIKIVFLTGRPEDQTNITVANLRNVRFTKWEKLILKDSSFSGKTAVVYKSTQRKKLEDEGYRIVGNIGDQWSDILGTNTGNRTFKLPDPMYYLS
ncbi:hypothetical protein L6164_021487 [Bauhinia variegata]|uniref:Uncharacterized protein n=1 Tax=Bauhinia variegata TaxID=167791 RepID=A0ACB9MYM7_BAUVA|nr:hypothetical protein L6164_021487 [Bauhinia variegata]